LEAATGTRRCHPAPPYCYIDRYTLTRLRADFDGALRELALECIQQTQSVAELTEPTEPLAAAASFATVAAPP
jgi:hypothetical protein